MAIVHNSIVSTGGSGSSPIVVANYSALPDPTTVSGKFYWCSASQGDRYIPAWLGGGTYYNSGMYYSNGTTWEFMNVPYQATQTEVNTGTNNDKFVTPLTFTTKLDVAISDAQSAAEDYTDAAIANKQDYPLQTSSSLITFDRPRVYGFPDDPRTTALTFTVNATTDKMVVQKIFHQAATAPFSFDSQVVRVAGNYVPNVLNIIEVERKFFTGGAHYLEVTFKQVDPPAKANDNAVVHLAAPETITGDKTFSGTNTFTNTNSFESTNQPVRFTRVTSNGSSQLLASSLKSKSLVNMSDGFGAFMVYYIEDNAGVENNIGAIGYVRDGADNNGKFVANVRKSGTANDALTIDSDRKATFFGVIQTAYDVEITDATKGIILKSPDGTRYRVTVANGGTLTTTAL